MRTNRPYVQIDPDVLERVRQIDLLSYLREFEPNNLVKVKGTSNVYCTAEHDSLKISNGKWYWWSRGFGGYSALDYLIKVKEYDFVEAVEILTGQTMADWKPPPAPKKDEPKVLLLPPKNKDCNRVIQYLFGRGIDYQLIQECIADGTLYESADLQSTRMLIPTAALSAMTFWIWASSYSLSVCLPLILRNYLSGQEIKALMYG